MPDENGPLEILDSLRPPGEVKAWGRLLMPWPGPKKYVAPPCVAAATGATPETGEDDRNCEEGGNRCWDCPGLVLGTCTADSCALVSKRCFTVIDLTFWKKMYLVSVRHST